MTHFFRLRPLLVFFCLVLTSCIDSDEYDVEGVTANPSITLPLAYGDLGIEDFLSNRDSSYIKVYDDGLVYLFYEQTLESPDIRNLIVIPDRDFEKAVPLPPAIIPPSSTEVSYAQTLPLDFAFDPQNMDRLLLKQGTIAITSTVFPATPAGFSYDVVVELPDFKKNGVAFSQRISGSAILDLSGYDAKFTDDVTSLKLTVIQKAHASPVTIPLNTEVRIAMAFRDMDFEFAEGFFGDQTTAIPDQTISVDPFTPTSTTGDVSIADPRLSFIVVNEYGIPVDVIFDELEARKNGSPSIKLQLSAPYTIPVEAPTTPGDSSTTSVSILNAKAILDYNPDQFYYKVKAQTNPGLTSGNNFCADTAVLKVRFRAEVPLYGSASGLILSDTTEIDISDVESSDVESIFLKAKIVNQLPLDARFQLYLADDRARIIDSIFTNQEAEDIIAPSTVTASGDLASPGVYDDEIEIPSAKVNKIFEARKLILVARMRTIKNADGTQPDVKFKASYKMNVKLGLRAELKVNVDL